MVNLLSEKLSNFFYCYNDQFTILCVFLVWGWHTDSVRAFFLNLGTSRVQLCHGLLSNTNLWIIFANMIHKLVFNSSQSNQIHNPENTNRHPLSNPQKISKLFNLTEKLWLHKKVGSDTNTYAQNTQMSWVNYYFKCPKSTPLQQHCWSREKYTSERSLGLNCYVPNHSF